MWDRIRDCWLPRLLFLVTVVAATALAGLVLVAPWLQHSGGLIELFADDLVVRRTALAAAAGLMVTAFVFFRPGGWRFLKSKKEKSRLPPPMAGA